MKVILYMATTINGYIAKPDGNTEWVCETDWKVLQKQLIETDAVIMGRKTYEISEDDFPYGDCLNVVLTKNKSLLKDTNNQFFTNLDPEQLLEKLGKRRKQNILIIGGGEINKLFVENGLIDELIISVHPLILGEGIKIFEHFGKQVDLDFVGSTEMEEGLVQLHYKIKR
ncbi:hypothetical protein COY16_01375 [Candidatus Roizmanbacteria bacterium CG_4_10_14_0_2_um_filter_39_13]|uniref:Bacterial bifunctional deaminase-reductase C-terminal domain-containing protein n=1 Tax=Candidatus Roizmanbacteria bacterium CG_4_10_14_0_2_um_filter_39_13 TaxID=1974825 RepID=A0A2M7U150_9BACT|nr:MAG: hypothetical protein COY16_01375 [Candidatus Roizmanbacteria bacterium CG_4_10_14_0_2_um_filter_39_13]